jgi:hypothetical protein
VNLKKLSLLVVGLVASSHLFAQETATLVFGIFAGDKYVALDTSYPEAPSMAIELLDKAKHKKAFNFQCLDAKDAHECFKKLSDDNPSKKSSVMQIETVHLGNPDAIPKIIDRFAIECPPPSRPSACQLMRPLTPFSVQSLASFPPGATKALWTRVHYSTWIVGHALTICYSDCSEEQIRRANFDEGILRIARVKE